jgi:hypothetical protein
MLVSYPLEPHPKDSVDTPEGNLESGAVFPRQMEERTGSADQRFFDRATSRHVYIPWLLIHEIFCHARRLHRISCCDAVVAGETISAFFPKNTNRARNASLEIFPRPSRILRSLLLPAF